jgi:hypothetical protein
MKETFLIHKKAESISLGKASLRILKNKKKIPNTII